MYVSYTNFYVEVKRKATRRDDGYFHASVPFQFRIMSENALDSFSLDVYLPVFFFFFHFHLFRFSIFAHFTIRRSFLVE